MPDAIQVKICGLTRPEDAEAAFSSGADYGGIILAKKSSRAVPLERVPEVLTQIPGGSRVMVDVATGTDELERIGDMGFDYFQIHFDLDISLATVAGWSGVVGRERLWLAPRIPPEQDTFPQVLLEFADTFVLDTYSPTQHGGTGKTGDWQSFADWQTLYQHKRWILAGGLTPKNIGPALAATGAEVVDVGSGVEAVPGIKDHSRIKALFAAIDRAREASTGEINSDDS